MVVVESAQASRFGRIEQHLQIARAHRIAVVGKAPRIQPRHNALGIVDRGDGSLRLLRDDLLKKLRAQRAFKIQHIVVDARQNNTKERLHHFQRIGHAQSRIPLHERLRVAIDRADKPVKAAVKEVVLGQQEVHKLGQIDKVVAAQGAKAAERGPQPMRTGRSK